jgi:hypothetical protein
VKTIRYTKVLTGAWEVWRVDVPDDTDISDLSAIQYDFAGELADSGYDSATIIDIDVEGDEDDE